MRMRGCTSSVKERTVNNKVVGLGRQDIVQGRVRLSRLLSFPVQSKPAHPSIVGDDLTAHERSRMMHAKGGRAVGWGWIYTLEGKEDVVRRVIARMQELDNISGAGMYPRRGCQRWTDKHRASHLIAADVGALIGS